MSINILLIRPPAGNNIQPLPNSTAKALWSVPPYGLAILSTVLLRDGFNVSVLDMEVEKNPWDHLNKSLRSKPAIAGITTDTITWPNAALIIDYVKKKSPSTIVIAGGPHLSLFAKESLKSSDLDLAVIGEGELPLLRIAKQVRDKKDWRGIPSTAFRDNDQIIEMESDNIFYDIHNLLPSWQLFPLKRYKSITAKGQVLSVISSRGCPYKCAFCNQNYMRYIERDPKFVAKEMIISQKCFKAQYQVLFDETFGINKENAILLTEYIKKHNISWDIRIRADIIDKNISIALANSNCRLVHLGAESSSRRILKLMNKKIVPEDTEKAIDLLKSVSISTRGYFMLGYPGESHEEAENTVYWAKNLPFDWASFSIAMPLPSTKMEKVLIEQKKLEPDFWARRTLDRANIFPLTRTKKRQIKLENLRKKAFVQFYLEPSRIKNLLLSVPAQNIGSCALSMISLLMMNTLLNDGNNT